ncbi:MAG: hypothetical protein JXR76_21925 [Deltaproteobacteria bacterium]|nr:hypothetical protein [Deltaproteobacteria bacterium]
MQDWQISTILSWSNPLVLMSLVAALVVVVWTYLTIDPLSGWKVRVSLSLIRLCSLLCAVYILMQPSLIVMQTVPSATPLAVVFDVSASMGFPADANRLSTAVQRARDAIRGATLSRKMSFRFFSFARTVTGISSMDEVALRDGEPGDTSFRNLFSHLTKLDEDEAFSGVLLLSDGADTSNISEQEVKRLGIPVNVAFIGSDSGRKDLLIKDVSVDEFAFSRKPNPLLVTIENHGLPVTEVKVHLLRNGKLLQQKTAAVIDGQGQVTFQVIPRQPGRHIYRIEIPVHKDETHRENNVRHVEMDVMRDKYRILHLSGAPTWDQRFMRDLLTQWPQVDLVSFYLLRTPYQSTTQSNAGLSLIPFPTEELFTRHLKEFDLLIFQDFDPATVGVDIYLKQIAEYVTDGGALVVSGGQGGLTSAAIANSPLGKLIPLAMQRANTPQARLISDAPFSPELTELGKRHPLFQRTGVAFGGAEEQLRSLPRLNGIVRMAGVQGDGQVLLAHPHIRNGAIGAPLMAVSEPDRGRILMVATDSLWSWGFCAAMTGAPAEYYTRFWKQAVRWLTHSRELSRVSLDIDKKDDSKNTPVNFNISLLNEEYLPAAGEQLTIEISWDDKNGSQQKALFDGTTNNAGMYRLIWHPVQSGPHDVRITTSGNPGLELSDSFLVEGDNREMNHLSPDIGRLREISDASGGVLFENAIRLDELKLKAAPDSQVLSRRDTALWSHPVTLILLFALIASEWFLRKRWGLI